MLLPSLTLLFCQKCFTVTLFNMLEMKDGGGLKIVLEIWSLPSLYDEVFLFLHILTINIKKSTTTKNCEQQNVILDTI